MNRGRALYRVVETALGADGRPARSGQIWQPDLDRTRRFGRVLAANSVALKVHVADASGRMVEAIAAPMHAPPQGWHDWRAQAAALPPLPTLVPFQARRQARMPLASPPPELRELLELGLPPVLPMESAVELTVSLPPA